MFLAPGVLRGCLKSEEFKHRVTEDLSYTERVKLEINTLCNSVSPFLSVERTFGTASFSCSPKYNNI